MSPEFWAIVGAGAAITITLIVVGDGIERRLRTIVDELRYQNRDQRKRDLL